MKSKFQLRKLIDVWKQVIVRWKAHFLAAPYARHSGCTLRSQGRLAAREQLLTVGITGLGQIMGSRIYEFLADSFLFREDFFDNTLSVSAPEIQKELDLYRDFVLQNEQELYADAGGHDSSLALYSAEGIRLLDLVHAALYVDRYILQDPLFELTAKRSEAAKALTKGGFVPPPSTDGQLDVERVRASTRKTS